MINPPNRIDNAHVIVYLILTATNERTRKTMHIVEGNLIQEVFGLAICKYDDDEGFYLFYCDDEWRAVTDTYHASVQDAKEQAAFEYTNTEDGWINPS
jgi:hypothetical protein